MNMKRFWILIGTIIAVITLLIGIIALNNHNKDKAVSENKRTVVKMASDFSLAWFNYTKQTDTKYMDKLKPLMTSGFYEATQYLNTQRPQDYTDQLPMTAKVLSAELKDYTSTNATVNVILETKESGSAKTTTSILINLVKDREDWLVSSFE